MTDVTRPKKARGTKLTVGVLAAALCALMAFAPFASAAPDPVGSGTTTITLNNGFTKYLKTFGITIQKVSPAKIKGSKATFTVTGGTLDPTTGLGTVTLGGGLKFKAGKKTAPVAGLVLDTTKKSLTGKVGGKKVKFATVAGFSFARNGFGVNLTVKKLKLTGAAASALNKKTGYAKGKPKPFISGKLLGSSSSETVPSTLAVIPAGSATLSLAPQAIEKLKNVGPPPTPGVEGPFSVSLAPIAPTTAVGLDVTFPIAPEGTISPTATAGTVKTAGGLQLTQSLEAVGKGTTTLKLANVWVDLGTKQASVEVVIENPKEPAANLGNLGRVSIADISLAGATIASDAATHTISVTNATATLQAVTAETLNSVFINGVEKASGEPQVKFAAGDPLGTVSFSVQTQ